MTILYQMMEGKEETLDDGELEFWLFTLFCWWVWHVLLGGGGGGKGEGRREREERVRREREERARREREREREREKRRRKATG